MTIEFLCPNGHQLTAGPDRVGKPGKCPKCGSKFVVPDADADADADDDDDDDGAAAAEVETEETIAFLCPNGHQLTGPARLQGRPGQCPHCGEKFRIPTYDEDDDATAAGVTTEAGAATGPPPIPAAEDAAEEDIPVGMIVEDDAVEADAEDVVEFPEEAVEVVEDSEIGASDAAPSQVIAAKPPPLFEHSLAKAFFQLWTSRDTENSVEVLLRDGKSVAPDRFSAELSQEGYAVFAVKDSDESFTVTTVPWDEVVLVRFQKLKQLPKGMFE